MKIEMNFFIILFTVLICMIKQNVVYLIFFISIFLHEIAHMILGICMGLKPKRIIINPLGIDLEFMNFKLKNKTIKKILIYLIGPLFNFLIAFICYYLNIEKQMKIDIVYTNIILGVFNLLPLMPLDGGKILKEILNKKIGIKKSSVFSLNLTKVILIIFSLIYSILIFKIKNIFLFFVIVYLWYLYYIEEKKVRTVIKVYNILDKV